jgi:hypothetical protein
VDLAVGDPKTEKLIRYAKNMCELELTEKGIKKNKYY